MICSSYNPQEFYIGKEDPRGYFSKFKTEVVRSCDTRMFVLRWNLIKGPTELGYHLRLPPQKVNNVIVSSYNPQEFYRGKVDPRGFVSKFKTEMVRSCDTCMFVLRWNLIKGPTELGYHLSLPPQKINNVIFSSYNPQEFYRSKEDPRGFFSKLKTEVVRSCDTRMFVLRWNLIKGPTELGYHLNLPPQE